MGSEETLELFDEPVNEYFVSNIARTESVEGILVRLYCCKQMGNRQQLQYTVLVPIKRMAPFGRQLLRIAAEIDGETKFWDDTALMN